MRVLNELYEFFLPIVSPMCKSNNRYKGVMD